MLWALVFLLPLLGCPDGTPTPDASVLVDAGAPDAGSLADAGVPDAGAPDAGDACASNNGGCDVNAACTSTAGVASCRCNPGYAGDGATCTDLDECLVGNGGCDPNATCTNTEGSRTCACAPGFTGDGLTCADINECLTSNGGCGFNATCTNTAGSRTCDCELGFTGDGLTCTDINECLVANGGCDANATCANTIGSRTCTCTAGFSGDGTTCSDVNECLTTNGGCDANATCANTVGSRVCACASGFTGDGFTCTDVNECLANNGGCDANAACANTIGSRTCTCATGYAGDGTTCSDVNECLTTNGGCDANATCTNTVGNRTCACAAGFTGDGLTCTDVNECLTNNGACGANRRCLNSPGSFSCGACESGFSGGPTGDCANINECASDWGGCAFRVSCIDLTPTAPDFLPYKCGPCPAGFRGDGWTCWSVNPCAVNNGGCSRSPFVQCRGGGAGTVLCDACPPGFFDPNPGGSLTQGRTCLDINECLPTSPTGGACINPLTTVDGENCVNTFGGCDTSYSWLPVSTPEVCSGGNGGCSFATTCTGSSTVPVTVSCSDCPSQPAVAPDGGGEGFNYRLPPTFARPYQVGNGADNAPPNGAGQCIQTNECLFDGGACDPLAICEDLEPITPYQTLILTPGRFGTYGGFRCACGPSSMEFDRRMLPNWDDPKAYNHRDDAGVVARCTPIPACATLCDPRVRCFTSDWQTPVLSCSTCPAGYRGSGYLAQGGCVPL